MNFIKSHWKLILLAIGVIIVLVWVGSVTGTNSKLYNMMLDQLTTDKDRIVEDQAKYIKDCEEEISKLAEDLAQSNEKIAKREGEINDLKTKLSTLTVSNDPGVLASDLLRYGVRIRIRNRNRGSSVSPGN